MPNIFNFWKQMYSADSSVDENSPTQFFQIVFFCLGGIDSKFELSIKFRLDCYVLLWQISDSEKV